MLEFLNQGWVGALLGAIGIIFGLYQILRRTGARLGYQYAGQRLIEAGAATLPDQVEVRYAGKPVPRLSLTQIVIWNDGRAPVRESDIALDNPLTLSFREAEILKIDILKSTRVSNSSRVEVDALDRSQARYRFSFLDRKDGALIRVFHTSERIQPTVSGVIIGLPKGVEPWGRVLARSQSWRKLRGSSGGTEAAFAAVLVQSTLRFRRAIFSIAGVAGIMLLLGAIVPEPLRLVGLSPSSADRLMMGLIGFVYGPLSLSVLWLDRRRFPTALAPDELIEGQDKEEDPKLTPVQIKPDL